MKTGTRSSTLAIRQSQKALNELHELFPSIPFELQPLSSPGDRDKTSCLLTSAPDFFTRDLDDALLAGEIDCAIHSAKDLPEEICPKIDWFWLPNPEDPRDVLIIREGSNLSAPGTVIGNSSDRREAFIRRTYPAATIRPIRGTIEERIAQLDKGQFDVILMAAAALNRLNLQHRISRYISTEELPPPDGQGVLALTFRAGDPRFIAMRNLFVKAVHFVSAGIGDSSLCTQAGLDALTTCDICLYDALMPQGLLDQIPSSVRTIYVGKRRHKHSHEQKAITSLIADYARQGKKVVRLKGGDAGLFGRLTEEIDRLNQLKIPSKVVPGVTSLSVATTGTGLLLTRRGIARGFKVLTTARAAESSAPLIPADHTLPSAIFMGINKLEETAQQFSPETPFCIIFSAGCNEEEIISGTAADIAGKMVPEETRPGIILTGAIARPDGLYQKLGALQGRRVWLTCSQAIQSEARRLTENYGGTPISRPLIALRTTEEPLPDLSQYDWIVLSSPSAVDCLMDRLDDVRRLPKILACGPGSERALAKYRLKADAMPGEDFSTEGMLKTAFEQLPPNAKILRLRSDAAGPTIMNRLRERFEVVDDFIVCHNEPVVYETAPLCDAIFVASPSACSSLEQQFGIDFMQRKELVAIGTKTEARLNELGLHHAFIARRATVKDALNEWAHHLILQAL